MIRNVLTDIGGIEIYPMISLVLFALVFAGATAWALGMRKRDVDYAGRLPLEDGTQPETTAKEQRT